jgi:hypothetical protein
MTISKIGGVGSNPTEGTNFDICFESAMADLHIKIMTEITHEARAATEAIDWEHLANPVYDELKESMKC